MEFFPPPGYPANPGLTFSKKRIYPCQYSLFFLMGGDEFVKFLVHNRIQRNPFLTRDIPGLFKYLIVNF